MKIFLLTLLITLCALFGKAQISIYPSDGATYVYHGQIKVNNGVSTTWYQLTFFDTSWVSQGKYTFQGSNYTTSGNLNTYGETFFDGTSTYISFGVYYVEIRSASSSSGPFNTIIDTNSLTLSFADVLSGNKCDLDLPYVAGLHTPYSSYGGYPEITYYYYQNGTCIGSHQVTKPTHSSNTSFVLTDCSAPASLGTTTNYLVYGKYDVVVHAKDQNNNWLVSQSTDTCFVNLGYIGKLAYHCNDSSTDYTTTVRPTVSSGVYTGIRYTFLDPTNDTCVGTLMNDPYVVNGWPRYNDQLYDCSFSSLSGDYLNINKCYRVVVEGEIMDSLWDASGDTCTVCFENCHTLAVSDSIVSDSCEANTGAIYTTITGGNSPYTYSWSNGATTADITGLSSGSYTLTVTDDAGCTQTITSVIGTVGAAHQITGNIQVVIAATGGAGASFFWFNDLNSNTYSGSSGQITVPADGAKWKVAIDDDCGNDTLCFLTPDLSGWDGSCTPPAMAPAEGNVLNDQTNRTKQSFNLYPNPNDGNFIVNYPETDDEITLYIAELSGKVVYEVNLPQGSKSYSFSNNSIDDGVYIYQIRDHDHAIHSGRIVVQH